MSIGYAVRLQKYLAECGLGSRRGCEELITAGAIRVNGQIVQALGVKIDPDHDSVTYKGRRVKPAEQGILLLNKPRRVVSTRRDPQGRDTVQDFLPAKFQHYFPVGRLDYNTSGLVIFTNDGELTQCLLHPSYQIERVYEVVVAGLVRSGLLAELKRGVTLSDGVVYAQGRLLKTGPQRSRIRVSLCEGRKHIVRRLFEELGHPVLELKRISHGPFRLGQLREGELRVLDRLEYEKLRAEVMGKER